jgi:outer membrane receptor protein involved in Fe transport
MAKIHAGLPLAAGWQAGLELLAEGPRQGGDGQQRRGPVLLNLNLLSDAIGPGLTVSLGGLNLLDQRVRQPVSPDNWAPEAEQDGRSLYVKLEARF